jgi:hypothetical protein
MDALMLIGYLLTAQLCQTGGDKPLCRDLPPTRFGGRAACGEAQAAVIQQFPHLSSEAFGLPANTPLTINVRCRAVYAPLEA